VLRSIVFPQGDFDIDINRERHRKVEKSKSRQPEEKEPGMVWLSVTYNFNLSQISSSHIPGIHFHTGDSESTADIAFHKEHS